jgi:hypothetical protein
LRTTLQLIKGWQDILQPEEKVEEAWSCTIPRSDISMVLCWSRRTILIFCHVIMNLLRNKGKGTDNLSIRTEWQVCRPYKGRRRLCWNLTRSLSSVQLNITYLYYKPVITKWERWTVLTNMVINSFYPLMCKRFPHQKLSKLFSQNMYTKCNFSNFQSHCVLSFRFLSASEAEGTWRISVLKLSLVEFDRGACKCVHMNLTNDWVRTLCVRLSEKRHRKRNNRRSSGSSSVVATVLRFSFCEHEFRRKNRALLSYGGPSFSLHETYVLHCLEYLLYNLCFEFDKWTQQLHNNRIGSHRL